MLNIFLFFENRTFFEIMWKSIVDPDMRQVTTRYCACALHAGYLRLQTHTQNIKYLLLFYCNNGYAKQPQCDVTRKLPVVCSVATEVRIFNSF